MKTDEKGSVKESLNKKTKSDQHPIDRNEFDVSIIIPAYNEEESISQQIEKVQSAMDNTAWRYNLIVVDDGSTDNTAEEAGKHDVKLVKLPQNQGYGMALKAGIANAASDYIVFIDADGTYPADAIPDMLNNIQHYDMVVGARTDENAHEPFMRKPAKWFLRILAGYLAEQNIPDLNSGLRVIRKSVIERFIHLLPQGFSFTTTLTLCLLCNNYPVYYHPINYYKRTGNSKIKPKDTYDFLLLILRTIVYFNPLKIFLPLGAIFFLVGFGKLIYDLFLGNMSETAIMGLLGSFIIWAIGLLSDQISRIGRDTSSK